MILKSSSKKQTKQIAKELSQKYLMHGGVIGLVGELGVGKTIFAQGFAEGLGITEKIISPTFVLIREHKIPNTKKRLFHIDLYRLESEMAVSELGIKEFFNGEDIVLIEWADKLGDQLPKGVTLIKFERNGESSREINISQ